MTPEELLDLYFVDARWKLIDIAALLDRVERAGGGADFRLESLRAAFRHLSSGDPSKAKAVLTTLSDPTLEPIAKATTKAATGAWPGFKS